MQANNYKFIFSDQSVVPEELKKYQFFTLYQTTDKKPVFIESNLGILLPNFKSENSDESHSHLYEFERAKKIISEWNLLHPNKIGLGFVLSKNHDIVVVDIDDENFPTNFLPLISALNSYTEYSPSGKCHIYLKVSDKEKFKSNKYVFKNHKFEIFISSNYVTLTGNLYNGYSDLNVLTYDEFCKILKQFFDIELDKETNSKVIPLKVDRKVEETNVENIVSILSKYYIPSNRQNLILATAGALYQAGYSEKYAEEVVTRLVNEDTDFYQRMTAVRNTYRKSVENVSGFGRLKDILEPDDFRNLVSLLSIKHQKSVLIDLNFTDKGYSDRLIDYYENSQTEGLLYVKETGTYFRYNLNKWEDTREASIGWNETEILKNKLQQEKSCFVNNEKIVDKYEKIISLFNSNKKRNALNDALKADDRIKISIEQFDIDDYLFNCKNCTINLRTLEIYDFQKDDLLTKSTNIIYDPDAECPYWLEFLNDIFCHDDELILYIQKLIGYCLTGLNTENFFHIFYGTGANGKSIFLDTIKNILGDYAGSCPEKTFLLSNKSDGPNDDIASLKGKRLVEVSEVNEGVKLNESLVKRITGSDDISCRFLYGKYFTYKPTYKIFILTNHKIKISGTDHGIWRRVRQVPFNRTFDGSVPRREIMTKLEKEYSGILNWALEGLKLYYKEGLNEIPDVMREEIYNYKSEMDATGSFISACCIVDRNKEAKFNDLYNKFEEFYKEEYGLNVPSKKLFSLKLAEKGFLKIRKMAGVVIAGISLKNS